MDSEQQAGKSDMDDATLPPSILAISGIVMAAMIAAAHDVTMKEAGKQCRICNQHKPADAYRGTRSACRECERIDWCPAGEGLYINTLEGHMKAGIGDMLIEGVKGELYGCRADIFAATYEPVETTLVQTDAIAALRERQSQQPQQPQQSQRLRR
jgi:hypothetical protein